MQAFLRARVGRRSALPAGGPDPRHHRCPTCCAQTPISSRQWLVAVWTETGKQRFGCSGQNAPRMHGGYRIRSDVETGGGTDGPWPSSSTSRPGDVIYCVHAGSSSRDDSCQRGTWTYL
jgi:hypothetical protein